MKKKLTKEQQVRRRLILGIVETQLRQNDPPETTKTLERLRAQGYSRDDAVELIAVVVASEIFDVMKQQQPFNRERFLQRLEHLPEVPED